MQKQSNPKHIPSPACQGMSCAACAGRIEKVLGEAGILTAAVNPLGKATSPMTHLIQLDDIIQTIHDLGRSG